MVKEIPEALLEVRNVPLPCDLSISGTGTLVKGVSIIELYKAVLRLEELLSETEERVRERLRNQVEQEWEYNRLVEAATEEALLEDQDSCFSKKIVLEDSGVVVDELLEKYPLRREVLQISSERVKVTFIFSLAGYYKEKFINFPNSYYFTQIEEIYRKAYLDGINPQNIKCRIQSYIDDKNVNYKERFYTYEMSLR